MSRAYYNEFNPYAAEWLRNLISAGHIADGDVDERSIVDVDAGDVSGYTQCHFFAGIGVWSHALRGAGWADDRPVWTGSCPCQPFSAAGKRKGTDDSRHLWPEFFRLINAVRPVAVFGEQVASKDGLAWFDAVSSDLEGAGYAVGAVDTCAAGFGAPHIRQRLYFVADTSRHGLDESEQLGGGGGGGAQSSRGSGDDCGDCDPRVLADDDDARSQGHGRPVAEHDPLGRQEPSGHRAESGVAGELALTRLDKTNLVEWIGRQAEPRGDESDGRLSGRGRRGLCEPHPDATNGHWRNADWLYCRDGKWRAVEPGTFPLAHGATARVGRLRAYGNGLVAPQAQAIIECYLELNR